MYLNYFLDGNIEFTEYVLPRFSLNMGIGWVDIFSLKSFQTIKTYLIKP